MHIPPHLLIITIALRVARADLLRPRPLAPLLLEPLGLRPRPLVFALRHHASYYVFTLHVCLDLRGAGWSSEFVGVCLYAAHAYLRSLLKEILRSTSKNNDSPNTCDKAAQAASGPPKADEASEPVKDGIEGK